MKRFVLIIVLSLIFVLTEILNWTCLALDHVLFPGWKGTPVRAPVFIIGMPRTGTTWLQSLLASDQQGFTSMKLWEILFAPSILQKKICLIAGKVDEFLHNILSDQLRKADNLLFRGYKPMHPTSFFDYGEDDLLLIHRFSGLFLIFLFPWKKSLNDIVRFDECRNKRRNQRIISFYKRCLQRHMYVFGSQLTYLSKGPGHTPKMLYLSRSFPDCRFICTIRQPEQSIPSAISLFIRFCNVYHTSYQLQTLIERTFMMADYWLPHPLEIFRKLEKKSYLVLNYELLKHDVVSAVTALYERFGMHLPDEFRSFLQLQQAQAFQSKHVYSSAQYGLSAGEISKRYGAIYRQLLRMSIHGNKQRSAVQVPLVKD